MAKLIVGKGSNEKVINLKSKNYQEVKSDVELFEIDHLLLYYGSKEKFLNALKESNLINNETYDIAINNDNGIKINSNNKQMIPIFQNQEIKDMADYYYNHYQEITEIEKNEYLKLRSEVISKNNSTRKLCLVLDKENEIFLTLKEDDKNALDKYTINNFKDSNDIRQKYQKEIDKFLEQNKEYLKSLQNNTNGRIVILEKDQYGKNKPIRILYNNVFKKLQEISNNLELLKKLKTKDLNYKRGGEDEKRIFSNFQNDKIFFAKNSNDTLLKLEMKNWVKRFENEKNYDVLRDVLKITGYDNKKVTVIKTRNTDTNEQNDEFKFDKTAADYDEMFYGVELKQMYGDEYEVDDSGVRVTANGRKMSYLRR